MEMSSEAAQAMKRIGETFVKNGFPPRESWWFKLPDKTVSNELRALGLIQIAGAQDRDGLVPWSLTAAGKEWIMARREA